MSFIIMALNTPTKHQDMNIMKAFADEVGAKVEPMAGVYNGKQERAYKLNLGAQHPAIDNEVARLAAMIAYCYHQECILYCDDRGQAGLIGTDKWPNWRQVDEVKNTVGQWREIGRKQAHQLGCYTFDPRQRKYFVAG